jgi:dihydropteroate synthase
MGVLNVTPDSFFDGGRYLCLDDALRRATEMVCAGALIVDVGGESSRPGASSVSEQEELDRVVPVVSARRRELDVLISVDTTKPTVMREAVAAGARMINDVGALRTAGALEAAAELGVPVCLMHMQGEPRTMQRDPRYRDVVAQVRAFLLERVTACRKAGIPDAHLVVDPGFGFGKTLAHNLALLRRLDALVSIGLPVLVGLSRKGMIEALLGGREMAERLPASVALALYAVGKGARIVRVHDVQATRDALTVTAYADGTLTLEE